MALPAIETEDRKSGADRLPTLTEVVELGSPLQQPTRAPDAPAAAHLADATAIGDSDELIARVIAELVPRVDAALEARLRDALAPALARAADGLIRDARKEMAAALRDLVAEAVSRGSQRGPKV